jgi:hypothetical protein
LTSSGKAGKRFQGSLFATDHAVLVKSKRRDDPGLPKATRRPAKLRTPRIISCIVLDFVSILHQSSHPEKKKMRSADDFPSS